MLLESELEGILCNTGLKNQTFSLHYESGKQGALKEALVTLCNSVQKAVEEGCEVGARQCVHRASLLHRAALVHGLMQPALTAVQLWESCFSVAI